MSFLSCAEMLAYAHEQGCTLAEAVLRSDLAESRLTEEDSRAEMRRLWRVMQATSRDYEPARRSRSGLVGGDAAKVEQAAAAGRLLGGDYLAAVTAEALKTAECNACMKRIVAAPTAGSCGVLPAVLLPLARAGEAGDEAICEALYVAAGFGQVIAARATLAGAEGGCQAEVGAASAMAAAALCYLKGGTPAACAAAAAMAPGQPAGPGLRPGGRPGGSALRETERSGRSERRGLRQHGPVRHRQRHPLRRSDRRHGQGGPPALPRPARDRPGRPRRHPHRPGHRPSFGRRSRRRLNFLARPKIFSKNLLTNRPADGKIYFVPSGTRTERMRW